jgi:signal transduction histidine kinase
MTDNLVLEKEINLLRQKLKLQEKLLEDKNLEIQNCLYTLTHELKTPLISIRGYSNLLSDFHHQELSEEVRDYLERISHNTDHIEYLIEDLIEFTRISIRREELEYIAVKELIEDVLKEIQYLLKEKDMDIVIANNMPVISCHKLLFACVYKNLISNAIKYSRSNTRLKIELGYCDDEIFHKFYVRDNGIGIPPKEKDKLFRLFSRLNNAKNVKGTGLGLAITKRIIESHGGEIWVESSRSKGASFLFTLPR